MFLLLSLTFCRSLYSPKWFRAILSQAGLAGKLIVPISALEETERVINYRRNRSKYKQARLVLNEIAHNPVWPLRKGAIPKNGTNLHNWPIYVPWAKAQG